MGICSVEGRNIILKEKYKIDEIVHDLKTPVEALKVLMDIFENIPPVHKKNIAQEAFRRIDDLMDNLSGDKKALFPFPILPFLQNIVRIKKLELSNTSITLNLKWDTAIEDLVVTIDQGELSRVIFNLLNNAQEAISRKGDILIKVFIQEFYLIIEIHDNGKGIPDNCLSSIFKKNQSFSKKKGHGFGLFHAKKTLEDLNGKINIKSQLNKKTCISLFIPLK